MNIAIIGYGKMGKTIESLAIEKKHKIVLQIDDSNQNVLTPENLSSVDVAIEFSTPDAAFDSITKCINAGVPVVSGTTGWLDNYDTIVELCQRKKGGFFYASNFSLGVNIFFKMNQYLAKIMNNFPEFNISIEETHHIHKLDAPSGTAITIADDIIKHVDRKKSWEKETASEGISIPVKSYRIGEDPGSHVVKYDSPIETIEITHASKSREGLAMGALLAAEFLLGKSGVFGMDDLLKLS